MTRTQHCYIFSRDRDFYQLLSNRVQILNTSRPAGQRIITPEEITRRFHVSPDQWCDRSALVGDLSDNIPGIRGVGTATAARLLADGLHLEDLPASGRLTGRTGEAIAASWQQVLTWRNMARAIDTIELPDRTASPRPESPGPPRSSRRCTCADRRADRCNSTVAPKEPPRGHLICAGSRDDGEEPAR